MSGHLVGGKEIKDYMKNKKHLSHKMGKFPPLQKRNDYYSNVRKRALKFLKLIGEI